MRRLMCMILAVALLGCLQLPLGRSAVASPEASFHKGIASYQDGDLREARARWQQVLDAGRWDGHVHYNIGNAWYREGSLGRAILAWRDAQVLLPRDPDVAANLARGRREVMDRVEPPEHVPSWLFWQRGLSPREGFHLGSGLLGLGLLFMAAGRWRRRGGGPLLPAAQLARRGAPAFVALGLLLCFSALYVHHGLHQRPTGVVLAPEVVARSAPGTAGVDLFVLREGGELRIQCRLEGYLQVALPDGRLGWVAASGLGVVGEASPSPEP